MGLFYGILEDISTKGKNSDYLQQQNRSLVVKMIMQHKVISRVDLATVTGLKPATISIIVKSLLDANLIQETNLIEGKNGRKVVGLCVNDKRYCSIVIRVTKGYWNIGIYEIYNECLFMNKVFINADEDMEQIQITLAQEIKSCLNKVSKYELLSIGFVFQGEMLAGGLSNKYTFNNSSSASWATELSKTFNVPVYVDKSVNMATYWNGNTTKQLEKDNNYMYLYVQVGYSVECCAIKNGKLMYPESQGGQLSHMVIDNNGRICECGNKGCLCQYISVSAVLNRVNELLEQYPDTALNKESSIRDVIYSYFDGDSLAIAVYKEVAEYLAILAVNLAGIYAPDEICFGDEIPMGKKATGFQNAVQEAYLQKTKNMDISNVKIRILPQERKRQKDITMQGCNQYLFDKILPTNIHIN